MHAFTSLAEVETFLTELSSESHHAVGIVGRPIVGRLPHQSVQKEARYAHTLCGAPAEPHGARETAQNGEDEYARKRTLALEEELATLKQERKRACRLPSSLGVETKTCVSISKTSLGNDE